MNLDTVKSCIKMILFLGVRFPVLFLKENFFFFFYSLVFFLNRNLILSYYSLSVERSCFSPFIFYLFFGFSCLILSVAFLFIYVSGIFYSLSVKVELKTLLSSVLSILTALFLFVVATNSQQSVKAYSDFCNCYPL